MPTTTTPWTKQTRDQLKDQARGYGLDESGTREDIYKRILNHLRDERRTEVGIEAVVAAEEEEEDDAVEVIEAMPTEETDEATDAAMELWRNEVVEPVSTLPEMARWSQMEAMAKVLCRSALMPKHIKESRDPEADCMVILLTAHDLGLSTTLALRQVNVIEGQPSLSAELMRLLIQRDGHDIKINVTKDAAGKPTGAEVLIHRKEWHDDDWRGDTYSMEDARTANLISKFNWKQHPKAMLIARATSCAARDYCADSLGGISYTPEELGAIDVDEVYDEDVPGVPTARDLTNDERVTIADGIANLEDDQRAWMREQWKARGLPALNASEDRPSLTDLHLPAVHELLREANLQPSEAEIVEDNVVGIMTTGYSGERTNVPDPTLLGTHEHDASNVAINDEVARAYARSHRVPKEDVETLTEHLAATDAALDESKEARASRARAIMEAARVKAEGAGLVEATGTTGLCPDCHKPMSEDNPKCMSHPL
jgi:hypothetical protein